MRERVECLREKRFKILGLERKSERERERKKKGISEACEICLTLSCVCLLWFSYLLF